MLESIIIDLLNWLNEQPEIADNAEREESSAHLSHPYYGPPKTFLEAHAKNEWDDYGTDITRHEYIFLRKPLDIRIFNQLALHLLPVNP